MSTYRWLIALFLLVALLLPASVAIGQETGPLPPRAVNELPPRSLAAPQAPDAPVEGAVQTPAGAWMMPADASRTAAPLAPNGGPDDYGYTFGDTPLNWIDASSGTDTGINGSVTSAGPITIGFPFKYYENTYSQLWVSRYGFLAFNDRNLYNDQSPIPSIRQPDDVIAPHWIPSSQAPNYVRYRRGGVAPNRWFVMEWNRQRDDCCSGDPANDEFTFQAILYENGDIVFQYQAMTIYGGYYCQASGIEDNTGLDGLSITSFCTPVSGYHAVRITRPAPSGRVKVYPRDYGSFFYPGEVKAVAIPVRNTGELGADTYDLFLSSSWATGLFKADGTTPLTDTDHDGVLDTGPVPQGQTTTVTVKTWTAANAQVGNSNAATLTVRSSLNTSKQKTATIRLAVPAPFAQVYRDDADGAMSLLLAQPQAQTVRKATDDWQWGNDVAIAELPNHNLIYVWSKRRCLNDICDRYGYEIEYTIVNPYGETVRPVTRLVDHSGATVNIYDYGLGVAVTPDGRIGLVWQQQLWNPNDGQSNANIYWAALNSDGDLLAGPTNVTNNTVWGTWSDLNVPHFYDPVIAATQDGRFALSWEREHRESAGWVTDIWYAVVSGNGNVIRGSSKLTNDTAGGQRSYSYSNLTTLSDNRTLLAFSEYAYPPGARDINVVVLNSDGNVVRGVAKLTNGGSNFMPDTVQLADGRVVVAWSTYQSSVYRTRFAVLDHEFNLVSGPTTLNNPAAVTGDYSVSVAAGGEHLAILTWMDNEYYNRRNLYYALVDSNGGVVTQPMIFQTSKANPFYIETSYSGYGNTAFTWTPPAGTDSQLDVTPPAVTGVAGGGSAALTLKLAGRGAVTATGVRLTATLDPTLSYLGDTSGVTPTVNGQTVIWTLPDLRLYDLHEFRLTLGVTGGQLGDHYPVQFQLTATEADLTPADNAATAQVRAARALYLPLLMR